ncbi:MAG: transglycosylase domain-containing protein [Sulfurimicrobium sp.]|nr:transglycosylase domain-containing protein [Sulfurimicrobium sp.]MDP1703829.1 transglycosylase domain-containing protein [Sulfurimicrobium sp.]MDP2199517.1 transglycosylase domain-containing protein [Sulfurimicrobium sp.]MDP2961484.1 transglycosylase domain-containing protein [Sulfurimicrobium sp.]MDZ7656505.1 transglycosylase domain-containing protein [Sulfurimicrobium sp.]
MDSGTPKRSILRRLIRFFVLGLAAIFFLALIVLGVLAYYEGQTSTFQAEYLARLGKSLRFELKSGPNPEFNVTQAGPYDERLGYSRIKGWTPRLLEQEFQISHQARISTQMQELIDHDLFAPYHEKTQAGLNILDQAGARQYGGLFPSRIYPNFDAVPALVRDTLLFIENRELLDQAHPKKNPALEWERLGRAVLDKGIQAIRPEHDVPGGSTLATQIEKYRHSPNGLTLSAEDKLQQMASASVRAYLDGENTLPWRKSILVSYLNTVPLAAVGGFGEVNGMGDGLWAWYGMDFELANRTLRAWSGAPAEAGAVANVYKHVLSLMIAQRRPSGYLGGGHAALEALTNSHLRVLAAEGVIPASLRDAAIQVKLQFRKAAITEDNGAYSSRKAVNAVRVRLASMLGIGRLYELDRLDLTVKTTLNRDLQQQVTEVLRQLREPKYARAAGLYGDRMLGTADPGRIIYSLNIHELTPEGSKLRIQADNYDQPFDINQGSKLDLGSTAKLRTLVSYLEIIEKLHQLYANTPEEELRKIENDPVDVLTRWSIDYLLSHEDRNLADMLDAALERHYSASPGEAFFTGGGVHYFHNFKRDDDGQVMSVRDATRNSVNLVFIRLMRDIERYYMFNMQGSSARILRDAKDPNRKIYLQRFADKEGKEFISRFYQKYRNKKPQEISEIFFSGVKPTRRRLAAAHRYVYPKASQADFSAFMEAHIPGFRNAGERAIASMYEEFSPGRLTLADQGYTVRVHPLELWLAAFLVQHPGAKFQDAIDASGAERIEVYNWLINTSHKNAQDSRIRNLLEVEAFLEIHRDWKRLGYPFDYLVPSLATAIGSSADRPAALADLMGIILNNGVRPPAALIEELHFAAGTPFETLYKRIPGKGERLFSPELASAVRGALINVVEHGTASRLARAIVKENGEHIAIGGKTGTGDHRYVTFSSAGVVKESRAVNRSATFVFFIGDRFYGTLTAFVPGAAAADYKFTSSLSAQILKHLLPTLKPLTDSAQPLPGKQEAPRVVVPKTAPGRDEAVDLTDKEEAGALTD